MIYSQWLPDRGGYQYYDVAERRGLGDDLPIPKLPSSGPIGVPSTEIGRRPPLAGKIVGFGPIARGCIMPLDRRGLSGIESSVHFVGPLLAGAAAALVGAILGRKLFRR